MSGLIHTIIFLIAMKREEEDAIIRMDIVPFTAENAIGSYVFANIIIAFSFFTINCNFYLNLH